MRKYFNFSSKMTVGLPYLNENKVDNRYVYVVSLAGKKEACQKTILEEVQSN